MRRSSERAFDMFTGLLIPANMMNQKRSDLGTRIDSISSGAALDLLQILVESAATEGGRMKRSRFNEEQIIAILKEQEAGLGTTDLCRKHGISSATFYKWKAKYGGLEVSDARRLKTLEEENTRLKKLLAEAMLDNAILKDVAAKKW